MEKTTRLQAVVESSRTTLTQVTRELPSGEGLIERLGPPQKCSWAHLPPIEHTVAGDSTSTFR